MLVFSISLKSKAVARDWNYTCQLLERTLTSIYNQTNKNFRVILVCHEKPEFVIKYPELICHEVEFSPPQKKYFEMVLDRNIKELIGRQISKDICADYIMNVDADDCIYRGISDFLKKESDKAERADCYFIDKGYIYYENIDKFILRGGFYNFCGSTVAVKAEYCGTPNTLKFEKLKAFIDDENFYSGGALINYLRSRGKACMAFPFVGCIYVRPASDSGLASSKGVISSLKRKDARMLFSPLKRNFEKWFKSEQLDECNRNKFGFYNVVSKD